MVRAAAGVVEDRMREIMAGPGGPGGAIDQRKEREAERKRAYAAELEAQMRETQRRKQQERAERLAIGQPSVAATSLPQLGAQQPQPPQGRRRQQQQQAAVPALAAEASSGGGAGGDAMQWGSPYGDGGPSAAGPSVLAGSYQKQQPGGLQQLMQSQDPWGSAGGFAGGVQGGGAPAMAPAHPFLNPPYSTAPPAMPGAPWQQPMGGGYGGVAPMLPPHLWGSCSSLGQPGLAAAMAQQYQQHAAGAAAAMAGQPFSYGPPAVAFAPQSLQHPISMQQLQGSYDAGAYARGPPMGGGGAGTAAWAGYGSAAAAPAGPPWGACPGPAVVVDSGASEEQARKLKEQSRKDTYRAELEAQIRDRQERAAKEARTRAEEDRRQEAEAAARGDPWGRAGAGAPLRGRDGRVLTDYKAMRTAAAEAASASPEPQMPRGHPQSMPAAAAQQHPWAGAGEPPAPLGGDGWWGGAATAAATSGVQQDWGPSANEPYGSRPPRGGGSTAAASGCRQPQQQAQGRDASPEPLLHFRSDKAFMTAAEVERRARAQQELQEELARQIQEKKAIKEAEQRSEEAAARREEERLAKEQERLAAQYAEERERERQKAEKEDAAVKVAGAWEAAKTQAAAERRKTLEERRRTRAAAGGGEFDGLLGAEPSSDLRGEASSRVVHGGLDAEPSRATLLGVAAGTPLVAGSGATQQQASFHLGYGESAAATGQPQGLWSSAGAATTAMPWQAPQQGFGGGGAVLTTAATEEIARLRLELQSEAARLRETVERQATELASLRSTAAAAEARSTAAVSELGQVKRDIASTRDGLQHETLSTVLAAADYAAAVGSPPRGATAAFLPPPMRIMPLPLDLPPPASTLRRSQQAPASMPRVFATSAHLNYDDDGGGGDALDVLMQNSSSPPLAAAAHRPARSASVPATAPSLRSADNPLLAVESAFIFPAGLAPLPPHPRDSLNPVTARPARVSDSMAALSAPPRQPRHTWSAPGALPAVADGAAAAAAAAEAPPGTVFTAPPMDDDLEVMSAAMAAARQGGEDPVDSPGWDPAAAASPEDRLWGSRAAAGGRQGGDSVEGTAGGGHAAVAPPRSPLDLPGLAARNEEKLRLLNSIDPDGSPGREATEALDAFLKRFVAESEAGVLPRGGDGWQQGGTGGGSGSGTAGLSRGPVLPPQRHSRGRQSALNTAAIAGSGGGGYDAYGGMASQSDAVATRDPLDEELDRLGLLLSPARGSGYGGSGSGGGGSEGGIGSTGGGLPKRKLRTSLGSFASRLAQAAVPPPLGLGIGLGPPLAGSSSGIASGGGGLLQPSRQSGGRVAGRPSADLLGSAGNALAAAVH